MSIETSLAETAVGPPKGKLEESLMMKLARLRIGSEDVKAWIITKFNEGLPLRKQAEILGISKASIHVWVDKLGIAIQRVAFDKFTGDEVIIRSRTSKMIDDGQHPTTISHQEGV